MSAPSDSLLAKRFLESLQQRTFLHYQIPPELYQTELSDAVKAHLKRVYDSSPDLGASQSFEDFYKGFAEDHRRKVAACPTPYEDPAMYSLMMDYVENLAAVAKKIGFGFGSELLFGTLHSGRVNGMAVAIPGCQTRVIILEHGLFGFANLMSKALAASFPLTSSEGQLTFSVDSKAVAHHLVANPEPFRRYAEALLAYVLGGNPLMARPYPPAQNTMQLANLMLRSMELFVLGHELGHVTAGHLGSANLVKSAIGTGGEVDTISTSWQQELEADVIGLILMMHAMTELKADLSMSYLGTDLFFGCTDAVERAVTTLVFGERREIPSASHPPTLKRRENLRNSLPMLVDDRALAEHAVHLASVAEAVLEHFWTQCEPRLVRMHKDGVRPVRWWQEAVAA